MIRPVPEGARGAIGASRSLRLLAIPTGKPTEGKSSNRQSLLKITADESPRIALKPQSPGFSDAYHKY